MGQFIIQISETNNYYGSTDLDNALKLMMGFGMDVINICKIKDGKFYVIVNTEKSKIDRLLNVAKTYMRSYNRAWGFPSLQEDLKNGKINQKKYDEKLKEMYEPITMYLLEKDEVELSVDEKRSDRLKDLGI